MLNILKQSTSVGIALGPFVDSSDGFTPETGLTITPAETRLKKNSAAWGAANEANNAVHEEEGWYEKEIDATDTNTLGRLMVAVYVAGALPVWREFMVVPANVYDSLVGGTDTLQADVAQWLGTAPATPTVAGVPEVDITHIGGAAVSTTTAQLGVNVVQISTDSVAADNLEAAYDGAGYAGGTIKQDVNAVQISGDSAAADNAEAFFDGTGYAGTNNTIPTVTTVGSVTAVAAGGITASSIAADAIGASELAADAVAEIADAIWDEARAGHVAAGSFGEGVASVQGNVTGSAASVSGNVAGNVVGSVGSLAAQAKADVNAEVLDVINVDTFAEPGQEAPASTNTLAKKIGYLFKAWKNKAEQTASAYKLYNDAGAVVDQTASVSDNGTTFTRAEIASGP